MLLAIGKCSLTQILLWSIFVINGYRSDTILAKDLRAVLPSEDKMPLVGFGTSGVLGTHNVRDTLDNALSTGYRLFDTAAAYNNEEDIGKALKELLPKHNLTRKDLFVTSKLQARAETLGANAYAALEKSLKNLDFDYLDLYLIHFPGVASSRANQSELRDESWKQLVKGVKNGLTRNIGVSNYNVKHLMELINNDHGVKVAVNQVEWNPHYHKDDILEFCRKNGILIQAYSSLGGTGRAENLLKDSQVMDIAERLQKDPAQILLRWALQENIAIIPKSLSRKHMESNLDLNFNIPQTDMEILNKFTQKKKHPSWDPDSII